MKEIFFRLFDIRKHKELLELSEKAALSHLPDDIRFYWEKASEQYCEDFTSFVENSHETIVSLGVFEAVQCRKK